MIPDRQMEADCLMCFCTQKETENTSVHRDGGGDGLLDGQQFSFERSRGCSDTKTHNWEMSPILPALLESLLD